MDGWVDWWIGWIYFRADWFARFHQVSHAMATCRMTHEHASTSSIIHDPPPHPRSGPPVSLACGAAT